MSFIPTDLFKRGKSVLTLERHANCLDVAAYDAIIASSVGKASSLSDQCFKFAATALSGSAYTAGFTTIPISMKNGDNRLAWAVELQLNGAYTNLSCQKSIVFSDGPNSLTFYATSLDFNADTLYTAVIGGVTTNGVLAQAFNISALYNSSRNMGSASVLVRLNLVFRVDVAKGAVSLWLGDQLKGEAAVSNLSAFGDSAFTASITHSAATRFLMVKDIGLRVEC